MSGRNYPEFLEDRSKLSAEEFCRKLCIWFEDQGLMSELRAHMRSVMITSLRGTSLGPKSTAKTMSPKFQAINLLIAEFLMQQQCHYTLSVFSVEAPLHDFTASLGNTAKGQVKISDEPLARFQQRDILDILETLGLSPDSEESDRVMSLYRENEHGEALLTCIFRILPAMSHNRVSRRNGERGKEDVEVPTRDTDRNTAKLSHQDVPEWTSEIFPEEIQNILAPLTLKAEQIQRLKKWLESKVDRVRKEEELKYRRELIERERVLQENLIRRDAMFRQLIDESQDRMAHERIDLLKGRQEMNEIAGQMGQNHEQMATRLNELEEWGERLRLKELQFEEQKHSEAMQLAKTTSTLDVRQHQLELEFQRLQREREEVEAFQKGVAELKRSLENASRNISSDAAAQCDLHQECILLRRELDSARHLLKKQSRQNILEKDIHSRPGSSKETDDMFSRQAVMAREMCRQLQDENSELRSRVRQQERRIEEVTSRASQLAGELEDTNAAMLLLSHRETRHPTDPNARTPNVGSRSSSVGIAAPLPPPAVHVPPPPPLPASPDLSQQLGSGEESVPIAQPIVANPAVVTTPGRHRTARGQRRIPPKRLVVYNQSSSDEASPTEDAIQEARRRLRAIEEESQAVDSRIKAFRRRFLESTTSAMLYPYSQATINMSTNDPSSSAQHVRRNHHAPAFGFHSEFENALPSYTRLNSRPSLYQQVSAASAQSRSERMTDLFRHSPSSDNDNSFVLPRNAQNAGSDFVARLVCANIQTREEAPSSVPTGITPDNGSDRYLPTRPSTRADTAGRPSDQDLVRSDSLRYGYVHHPRPVTPDADIPPTFMHNNPQTSRFTGTRQPVDQSVGTRNIVQTAVPAELSALLIQKDKLQPALLESNATTRNKIPTNNQSTRDVELSASCNESANNLPVPSLMCLLDAPTGEMVSSETNTCTSQSSTSLAEDWKPTNNAEHRRTLNITADRRTLSIAEQQPRSRDTELDVVQDGKTSIVAVDQKTSSVAENRATSSVPELDLAEDKRLLNIAVERTSNVDKDGALSGIEIRTASAAENSRPSNVSEEQRALNDVLKPVSIVDISRNSMGSPLNRETDLSTSEKPASVQVEPLHYPQLQLDTSRLETSLDRLSIDGPSPDLNQQDDKQLVNASLGVDDRMKHSSVLSGTNTSGSAVEGAFPQLGNISVSSIEMSSDQAISQGGDKDKSEMSDDFWN